jgi:predicted membrane channel-forming protein YqfA (hemolysin III family)
MNNTESYTQTPVIELDENSRGQFIARAYNHLFGAITAFVLLEVLFFKTGLAEPMAQAMLGTSWLLVLGGFMVVSWIARSAAHRAVSKTTQYAALAGCFG